MPFGLEIKEIEIKKLNILYEDEVAQKTTLIKDAYFLAHEPFSHKYFPVKANLTISSDYNKNTFKFDFKALSFVDFKNEMFKSQRFNVKHKK